jgi:nucleoside-diphosphate kinase
METERTLTFIKPDIVSAGRINDLKKFIIEDLGFNVVDERRTRPTKEQIEEHYAEHNGKSFYDNLCKFTGSNDIVLMVIEGKDVIKRVRDAIPQIRQKFGTDVTRNALHASDSSESAQRELKLWGF